MRLWVILTFAMIAVALAPVGTAHADCAGAPCDKPAASYAAIAYGAKSTAYGYAFAKPTQQEAERGALAECLSNGDDCKLAASFADSCGAVAAIESKALFSTGKGPTEQDAKDAALKTCERTQGRGCQLEVWTCAKQ